MEIKDKIDKIKFIRLDEKQKYFLYLIDGIEEYEYKKEPNAKVFIKDNLPYFIIYHNKKMVYYNYNELFNDFFNFYNYNISSYAGNHREYIKSILFREINNFFGLDNYLVVSSKEMHRIKVDPPKQFCYFRRDIDWEKFKNKYND